ncbi:calcium-binding protein [Microvirga sp. 2MCAF35]|uniref:calcium-binding protein n=1 Tax=Microvirga sp. 2MCAF35 TaxID=3232987 RepID=UPI003F99D4E6
MTFSIQQAMFEFFSGSLGSYWGTNLGRPITGAPTGGSPDFDWGSEIPEGTYIDMEVVGQLPPPNIPEEWQQRYIDGNYYFFDDDGRLVGGSVRVSNPGSNLFNHVPRDAQGRKLPGTWYVNGQKVIVGDAIVLHIGDAPENGNSLEDETEEYVVHAEAIILDLRDEADGEIGSDDATLGENAIPLLISADPIVIDIRDLSDDESEESDAPLQPEMHFEIVDTPLSSAWSEGKGAYVQLGSKVRMQNIRFVDDKTGQERIGSFSLETSSGSKTQVTVGTSGNDTISGSGWLMGANGNDSISGGANADLILGGDGNDMIAGGAGADTLNGGNGIDTLVYTASSNAYVDLRTGAVGGQAAGDVILNFENVIAGAGNDTLYGSAGANELNGQGGDDLLAGGSGHDTLLGGAGNDSLYGDDGNDLVMGGAGNDIIQGGAGADTLSGGDGTDTLVYGGAEVALVDLRTGYVAGQAAGDVISGFENVVGGSGHDTVYGSVEANELNGQGGNDILAGADGADTLWGGNGNDWLEGGNGNDVVSGGAGADTLDGGAGTDTLVYGSAEGALVDLRTGYVAGQAAGDVISGFENVVGGSGHDTVYGSADANELNGQDGNDILAGADGADTLWGGNGNDWLEGGSGNDLLAGGAGDDRLVGGAGNDALHGEAGRDTFVFDTALNATTNVDEIVGFSAAEDWIGLSRSVFASATLKVGASATTAGAQIVYNAATGDLSYDADGVGGVAQVKFAHLAAGLVLTSANFVLI